MSRTSERIREAMEKKNLKQADVVRITGIDKGALSSYLSGKYLPKQDNIYLLAKALGVSESWLLGYDSPVSVNELASSKYDQAIEYIKEYPVLERLLYAGGKAIQVNEPLVMAVIQALEACDNSINKK